MSGMQRTYTYNRPIIILFLIPLGVLLSFLSIGLFRAFNLFLLLMALFSLFLKNPEGGWRQ